jgi:hypothetical protein
MNPGYGTGSCIPTAAAMAITFKLTMDDLHESNSAMKKIAASSKSRSGVQAGTFGQILIGIITCGFVISIALTPWAQFVQNGRRMRLDPSIVYLFPLFPALWLVLVALVQVRKHAKGNRNEQRNVNVYQARPTRSPVERRWSYRTALFIVSAPPLAIAILALAVRIRGIESVGSIARLLLSPVVLAVYPAALWLATLLILGLIHVKKRQNSEEVRRVLDENHTCETSDSAITFASESKTFSYAWHGLERFVETPNLILVFTSKERWHTIPKRAFASVPDEMDFLAMLSNRIGSGWVLRKDGRGFPVVPLGTDSVSPPPAQ